jgi:hypothetical protein
VLAVRLIEQVGAYAGIAAIPGLAVLSALYFSQARDVKRLREWAGRAPERAAEQAAGGRVAVPGVAAGVEQEAAATAAPAAGAPAVPKPATATQPAQAGAGTAAKPATAPAGATPAIAAAAAGAQAATAAGPAAATPAGKAATPSTDATTPGAATTNGEGPSEPAKTDKPAALTPAAVASAAAAKSPASTTVGAAGGGGGRTGPPAVGGVKPGAPTVRKPIPRMPSAQTSILTPTSPPKEPWYRRLAARMPAARYIALIVAGALVLGGGAAYGISQLASSDGGGDSSSTSSSNSPSGSTKTDEPTKTDENVTSRPSVNPADVTVTVVNGTTIPNLARDTASKLSAIGFQIGNKVTGTGTLAAAESVVEYKPGAEDEAHAVATKLDISQKQPADADALAQAGPAQVIVVLGADQAPGG